MQPRRCPADRILTTETHKQHTQVPRFLGVSVGLIQADMDPEARRAAYASGITYVTNSELGFDYLRDNLAGVSAALAAAARAAAHCSIQRIHALEK